MPDSPPERDRTVILLGAGASKASCHDLPVMHGFFRHTEKAPLPDRVAEHLERIYGTSVCRDDWNLEEAIAHLDMLGQHRDGASSNEQRDTDWILDARRGIEDFVVHRLAVTPTETALLDNPEQDDDPSSKPGVDRLYGALLSGLLNLDDDPRAQGTVISTNYDLLADYALSALQLMGAGRLALCAGRPRRQVGPTTGSATRAALAITRGNGLVSEATRISGLAIVPESRLPVSARVSEHGRR